MRTRTSSLIFGIALVFLATGAVQAETKVTLKKMHLCCGACVKAVNSAIGSVDGATVSVDRKGKSVTITASDDATAQKAVDAIAAAGFHGESDHAKVVVRDDSGVKAGKISRIELVGVHNCCGGCNVAIKKAIDSVAGVEANTAKPKSSSVVVEGSFDGAALTKALFAAGFHVRAKKK